MKRVEVVDEPLLVHDRDRVPADEYEFRMRDGEFLAVGGANRKGAESSGQPFSDFLNVHDWNLSQRLLAVKATTVPVERGRRGVEVLAWRMGMACEPGKSS